MGPRTRLAATLVVLLAAPTLAANLGEIQKTGVLRVLKALDEHITNVRRSIAWNRLVVKYFGASALEVLREARAE